MASDITYDHGITADLLDNYTTQVANDYERRRAMRVHFGHKNHERLACDYAQMERLTYELEGKSEQLHRDRNLLSDAEIDARQAVIDEKVEQLMALGGNVIDWMKTAATLVDDDVFKNPPSVEELTADVDRTNALRTGDLLKWTIGQLPFHERVNFVENEVRTRKSKAIFFQNTPTGVVYNEIFRDWVTEAINEMHMPDNPALTDIAEYKEKLNDLDTIYDLIEAGDIDRLNEMHNTYETAMRKSSMEARATQSEPQFNGAKEPVTFNSAVAGVVEGVEF